MIFLQRSFSSSSLSLNSLLTAAFWSVVLISSNSLLKTACDSSDVFAQEKSDVADVSDESYPEIWLGSPSFVAGSAKKDFIAQITDANANSTVLSQTQVVKLYIEMFNYFNDDELKILIRFFNERGFRIAFETGGLRAYAPDYYSLEMGRTTYAVEGKSLRRWRDLGGRVDFVVVDHAVPLLTSDLIRGTNNVPIPDDFRQNMDWRKACEMLADYFVELKKDFPETKIALVDSLAYFSIVGRDGSLWKSTDPRLVDLFSFADYIDRVVAELKKRNLTLDHFQIDHGMEVAIQDNFQRIFGVEDYCRKIGLPTAMILNNVFVENDPRRDVVANDVKQEIETIYEYLPRYVEGYFQGGRSEKLVLQRWQIVPTQTGPETEPLSVLGIARATLENKAFPKKSQP